MKRSDHSAKVDRVTRARASRELLAGKQRTALFDLAEAEAAAQLLTYGATLEEAEGISNGPAMKAWREAMTRVGAAKETLDRIRAAFGIAEREERDAVNELENANFGDRRAEVDKAYSDLGRLGEKATGLAKETIATLEAMYKKGEFVRSLWPTGKPIPGGALLYVPEIMKAYCAELYRIKKPEPLSNTASPSLPGAKNNPVIPTFAGVTPLKTLFAEAKEYVLREFDKAGRAAS